MGADGRHYRRAGAGGLIDAYLDLRALTGNVPEVTMPAFILLGDTGVILFSEKDDVRHLSLMRSVSVTLTAFFVAAGVYMLLNGKTNGAWMLLLSLTSAFMAWDAHSAYKAAGNVAQRRKELGY